ncbi:copper transporter 6-like [Macadamia integrifolia]|uniref:copper transporter 6-like n=1 Tax=Macadamia integrifolia TaxID=60698 RepID=UPI001C4FEB86|nr:copper transporter 6-like [Macadamia integrifolia]
MDQPGKGTTTPQPNSTIHMTTFFWGKQVEILFPGFPDQNLGLYVLSLFFVAMLAAAVEVLKATTEGGKQQQRRGNDPRKTWLIQSGVHMLRVGLIYMVMLSVVSYNAGIFLAAVAGHTLGFLVSTRPVASPVNPLLKEMSLSTTNSSSLEA